jgi:hypothetical protein
MKQHCTLSTRLSLVLCFGGLLVGVLPSQGQDRSSAPAAPPAALGASTATAEEHESDKHHLLAIYKALKAYEKDHGKLPDWLSDLVPKYLPDPSVLVSPVYRRTGTQQLYGNDDPKMTTSYIYEFNAAPVPQVILGAFPNLTPGTTMRDWKTKQVAEFGPVVPILRCFLHTPVLNVTSDGEFFESGAHWEIDPKTLELRKKRLASPSKPETKQPKP